MNIQIWRVGNFGSLSSFIIMMVKSTLILTKHFTRLKYVDFIMQGHKKRKEIDNINFRKRSIIFLCYWLVTEKVIIIYTIRSLRDFSWILFNPCNDVLRLPQHSRN